MNHAQQENTAGYQHYYVPHQSSWPILGAVALFFIGYGAAHWVSVPAGQAVGWMFYLLPLGF